MQQAIPGAILLQVVEHHWALRSCIAQLAFRELAFHAPPYVGPTLALKKLAAVDSGIFHDVLHVIASVALKNVARLGLRRHNAPRALCVDASPCRVSQVFGDEVALRSTQLAILGGAAGACARVEHCLVHGMTSFCGLLAHADFAAEVRRCARQSPLLLHILGEI